MSSSREPSQPRDQTPIACISCIGRQILHLWATWEALKGMLLAPNRQTPGMLLNIPQCTGKPHPQQRLTWSQMLIVLRLRNSALDARDNVKDDSQILSNKVKGHAILWELETLKTQFFYGGGGEWRPWVAFWGMKHPSMKIAYFLSNCSPVLGKQPLHPIGACPTTLLLSPTSPGSTLQCPFTPSFCLEEKPPALSF